MLVFPLFMLISKQARHGWAHEHEQRSMEGCYIVFIWCINLTKTKAQLWPSRHPNNKQSSVKTSLHTKKSPGGRTAEARHRNRSSWTSPTASSRGPATPEQNQATLASTRETVQKKITYWNLGRVGARTGMPPALLGNKWRRRRPGCFGLLRTPSVTSTSSSSSSS